MTADSRADRPSQLTVGLLRPSLLVHLGDRSAYGYELRGQLAAIGLQCDLGTVYRALNTMEDEGLLRSSWERSSSGRSRRRYELSEAGAEMIEAYAESVGQFVRVAEALLAKRSRHDVTDDVGVTDRQTIELAGCAGGSDRARSIGLQAEVGVRLDVPNGQNGATARAAHHEEV